MGPYYRFSAQRGSAEVLRCQSGARQTRLENYSFRINGCFSRRGVSEHT